MELASNNLLADALAYYRFEGNSTDTKGSFNGSDSNITYSAANGKYGQGAGFNGSTSVITIGNVLDALGTAFSISGWFKTGSAPGAGTARRMVAKYAGTGSTTGSVIFDMVDSGTLRFLVLGEGISVATTGTYVDDAWYHMVAVHDSSNNYIYVNGVQVATDVGNASLTTLSYAWSIGEDAAGGTTESWDGEIDDVAIFSKALSPAEILALYKDSSGMFLMF